MGSQNQAAEDPVFIGVGELPSGRYPNRSFIGDLTAVALRALKDARMVPRDVDTIVLIPNLHSFNDQADLIFSRLVEELGIAGHAKASFMVHSGGSTSDNAVFGSLSSAIARTARQIIRLSIARVTPSASSATNCARPVSPTAQSARARIARYSPFMARLE